MTLQSIQPELPELAVVLQPGRSLAERRRIQPATMLAPHHLALDEPRPFEHQNVFRDRVERYRKWPGNLGNGGWLLRQSGENGPPRGVRNRCENPVETLGVIFNHLVEYRLRHGNCQALEL